VSTPKLTFALVEKNGVVVMAAPVSRWAIGKPIGGVIEWWRRRGADDVRRV